MNNKRNSMNQLLKIPAHDQCKKVAFASKAKAKLFIRTSTNGCKTHYKCKICAQYHVSSHNSDDKRRFKDMNARISGD